MKTLPSVRPTPEQLRLISDNSLGIEVIRGAAGSGKTSTAILRLRSLAYMFEERRQRESRRDPVRILVLTFNRTLSGYIRSLVDDQVSGFRNTIVEVETFARWAIAHLSYPDIVSDEERYAKIRELAAPLAPPSASYLVKEVEYLLGRFLPEDLEQYVTADRAGRGAEPRVERTLRRRILAEVIKPYKEWLLERDEWDWNDVAVAMGRADQRLQYDIIIVDESQDFSANQLRALHRHVAPEHAVTFVIDTIQRIYARGFTWAECGFDMRAARYHSLRENHRNTVEIAAFAAGILTGVTAEADGALPDLSAAKRHGPKPKVLKGLYRDQLDWAIEFLTDEVDLENESVAFLKPEGGGFFRFTRQKLSRASLPHVDITRQSEWPEGAENIALSTFHSAKGLEFDHVMILGLSQINTNHGDVSVDDQLAVLRRLLAVAVARARQTVILGYKPGEESRLVHFFAAGTFDEVDV